MVANLPLVGNYSGIHGVALNSTVSRSNWNLEMLVFAEGGKPDYPEKNPQSRDDNNKLNPRMTPRPGIEPEPHWWEASALTTAPSCSFTYSLVDGEYMKIHTFELRKKE